MLRVRVISALLLLPLVLAAFIAGPGWFVMAFLALCAALCVREMAGMAVPELERRFDAAPPASEGAPAAAFKTKRVTSVAVVLAVGLLLASAWLPPEGILGALVLALFAALLIGEVVSRSIDQATARAFGILISVCYGGLPWLIVWQLYKMADHAAYVLLVMAVTWCGDTGAYFGGRFFGGKLFGERKLAPTISPKKTWEGAVAGLLLSVVGAFVLDAVYRAVGWGGVAPALALLLAGLFGGICEQLGDLLESLFKRFAGVKDSGTLIPGHGGFLDRVDGILLAAPVIWAVLFFLVEGRPHSG